MEENGSFCFRLSQLLNLERIGDLAGVIVLEGWSNSSLANVVNSIAIYGSRSGNSTRTYRTIRSDKIR